MFIGWIADSLYKCVTVTGNAGKEGLVLIRAWRERDDCGTPSMLWHIGYPARP
jgi:hypothetical protein